MKRCFPCNLALALFLILAVHAWAEITSAYFTYLWMDMPMHFAGGAWIASAAYYFFFLRGSSYKISISGWIGVLFLVGVSVIVGVWWEFFEFSVDYLFVHRFGGLAIQGGLADTLSDLFFDFTGGFLMSAYLLYAQKSFNSGDDS